MNTGDDAPFEGAKVALFLGDRLAVILRDDLPGLAFAGQWDLPGGGREGDETPLACVARECFEELGLRLRPADIRWSRAFVSATTGVGRVWFFAAQLPAAAVRDVVFGSEGQRWTLMSVDEFLNHPNGISAFQARLAIYLAEKKSGAS